MAAGLVVAGLPQAVAAAAPCSHWGFTGDTTFDFDGGGKLECTATGQAASGQATQTDQKGHTVTGTVSGAIDGDVVGITFLGDGDLWHFNAAINAGGSAQGVFEYDGGIRTGTWHASAPLACQA